MTPWNVPVNVKQAFVASSVRARRNPLAGEVNPNFRSDIRTQLPINPRVYALVAFVQSHLPFNGKMPRIVNKVTRSEIWLPGKSRNMNGNQRLDSHQAGVAIDFMVSTVDPVDNVEKLACWLGINSQAIGLQRLIWRGMTLDGDYPAGDFRRVHTYTGKQFHGDHIHCELNPDHMTMFYVGLPNERKDCK